MVVSLLIFNIFSCQFEKAIFPERYNALKSAIHIVKEEIVELATTEEVLYDAIVCDITPSCKPSRPSLIHMSRILSKLVLDLGCIYCRGVGTTRSFVDLAEVSFVICL